MVDGVCANLVPSCTVVRKPWLRRAAVVEIGATESGGLQVGSAVVVAIVVRPGRCALLTILPRTDVHLPGKRFKTANERSAVPSGIRRQHRICNRPHARD